MYLDIFADQSEFPERSLGIILILEISQWNLIDTSLQTIRGNLGSSSSKKTKITQALLKDLMTNAVREYHQWKSFFKEIPWVCNNGSSQKSSLNALWKHYLLTKVLPTWRTLKTEGALISYLQIMRTLSSIQSNSFYMYKGFQYRQVEIKTLFK